MVRNDSGLSGNGGSLRGSNQTHEVRGGSIPRVGARESGTNQVVAPFPDSVQIAPIENEGVRPIERGFSFRDPTVLRLTAVDTHPAIVCVEGARNPIEVSGLSKTPVTVQIGPLFNDSGKVIGLFIQDDSIGMSLEKMERCLLEFGTSSHQISESGNLGFGAKWAAGAIYDRAVYRSWVDGKCHQVIYGVSEVSGVKDSLYQPVPETTNQWAKVVECARPNEARSRSGTRLEVFSDDPRILKKLTQREIVAYVESRFLRLDISPSTDSERKLPPPRKDSRIVVYPFKQDSSKKVVVVPQLVELKKSSEVFGSFTTKLGTYYYGTYSGIDPQSDALATGRKRTNLMLARRDEVFAKYGQDHLLDFGVDYGAYSIWICIEFDPERTITNHSRTAIQDQKRNKRRAAIEFSRRFPKELREHIDLLKQKSQSVQPTDELRSRLIESLGLPQNTAVLTLSRGPGSGGVRPPPNPDTKGTRGPKTGSGKSGGKSGGQEVSTDPDEQALKKNQRLVPPVRVIITDRADLGAEPFQYTLSLPLSGKAKTQHELRINRDIYAPVRDLLSKASENSELAVAVAIALIEIEFGARVDEFVSRRGDRPSNEVVEGLISGPILSNLTSKALAEIQKVLGKQAQPRTRRK